METTLVKKLYLSSETMTANQISTFTEQTYQKNEYTAIEVFPTNKDIDVGTIDSADTMSSLFNLTEQDVSSMNWTDMNWTGLQYGLSAPSCMSFVIVLSPRAQLSSTDIVIDWGDSNVSVLNKMTEVLSGEHYKDNLDGILTFGIGNRTGLVAHTYEKPGKYIVKVFGNTGLIHGPYNDQQYTDKYGNKHNLKSKYNLTSRIFESDLPVSKSVSNVSSVLRTSRKTLRLKIPYGYDFKNINNMSNGFGDTNICQIEDDGGRFNRQDVLMQNAFSGMKQLTSYVRDGYTNTLMPTETPYNGVNTSYYAMFDRDDKLSVDILDLLPEYIENTKASFVNTFSGCTNLYCSNYDKLSRLLWNNKTVDFVTTSYSIIKDNGTTLTSQEPKYVDSLPILPAIDHVETSSIMPNISTLTEQQKTYGYIYVGASTANFIKNRLYVVRTIDDVEQYVCLGYWYGNTYQLKNNDTRYGFSRYSICTEAVDNTTHRLKYILDKGTTFIGCTGLDLSKIPMSWGGNAPDSIICKGDNDTDLLSTSINAVQNCKLTDIYNQFFTNGYVLEEYKQLSTDIPNDRTNSNGGFYSIYDAGNVLILGTYKSGLMYYHKAYDKFYHGNLIAANPNLSSLEDERKHFNGEYDSGARIKQIFHLNNKYIALDVSQYNTNLGIYSSNDGIDWTLNDRLSGDTNLAGQSWYLNSSIAFYDDKYYICNSKDRKKFVQYSNANDNLSVWHDIVDNANNRWELSSIGSFGQMIVSNGVLIVCDGSVLYDNNARNKCLAKIYRFDLNTNNPLQNIFISSDESYQEWSLYADNDYILYAASQATGNNDKDKVQIVKTDSNFEKYEIIRLTELDKNDHPGAPRGIQKFNNIYYFTTYKSYCYMTADLIKFTRIFKDKLPIITGDGGYEGATYGDGIVYIPTRKYVDKNDPSNNKGPYVICIKYKFDNFTIDSIHNLALKIDNNYNELRTLSDMIGNIDIALDNILN